MFAQYLTRLQGRIRRGSASLIQDFTPFGIVGVTLLLSACGALPPGTLASADPANPHAPVPRAVYRDAVGPYTSARPKDAGAWQQQNERVAPEPQSGN